MRFLYLVEEYNRIRVATDCFRELSALIVTDIAGRSANKARDTVLLHIFTHVESHHHVFVCEHEFCERLCQLGFADAGRTKEQERADWLAFITDPRARTTHRICDRLDRVFLADDAFAEFCFHMRELFRFFGKHALCRNTRPA